MLNRRVFLSIALVFLAILSIGQFGLSNAEEDELPISLYEIVETDNKGNELKMETLKGKVLFIINTATRCPYTKEHFSLFRRLFKYRRHGLEIILAPSNQFMQEPGDDKSIMVFAKKQLFSGIILTKGDVNGKSARTLFKFLKDVTGKKFIEWNFDGKFLCDREGNCSLTSLDTVEAEVMELLGISHDEL